MNDEQFKEATANTTAQYDLQVRQVSNGFNLTGTVRYVDNSTHTVRVAQSFEAVATNNEAAAETGKNFLLNGTFEQ